MNQLNAEIEKMRNSNDTNAKKGAILAIGEPTSFILSLVRLYCVDIFKLFIIITKVLRYTLSKSEVGFVFHLSMQEGNKVACNVTPFVTAVFVVIANFM